MSFPVVEATNTSEETAAVTAHDVALPASVSAGDLLLAMLGTLGGIGFGSMSPTSGWDEVLDNTEAVVEKATASGGETTVQFQSANTVTSAHNAYRISGQRGDVEIATADNTRDPPDLTPTWGSANTLWIAGVVAADILGGTIDVTAAPTNYSGLIKSNQVLQGGVNYLLASAWRQLTATSENPGSFTLTGTGIAQGTFAFTIAVRPAGSAGGARRSFGYIIGA